MFTLPTSAIKAAIHCAAKKDIRHYLNGVLIECAINGDVHIVSTDGSMLFAGLICAPDVQWIDKQSGPFRIIVPIDAAKLAAKSKSQVLTLTALPDGRYSLGDVIFTAVDGVFPDWRRVSVLPAVIETREKLPSQFNPDLLVSCRDALHEWHGEIKKVQNVYLYQSDTNAGVMVGADMTAFCIIMPMREHTLPQGVMPFTPSSYGA